MSDWKLVNGVYEYKEDAANMAKEYQGGDEYCCIDKYRLKKLEEEVKLVKLNGASKGEFTTSR